MMGRPVLGLERGPLLPFQLHLGPGFFEDHVLQHLFGHDLFFCHRRGPLDRFLKFLPVLPRLSGFTPFDFRVRRDSLHPGRIFGEVKGCRRSHVV